MKYSDLSGLKVYICLVLSWVTVLSQELSAAGVTVWQSDSTTIVSEGQEADMLSVRLASQPLADVSINITPGTADLELNGDFPGDAILLYFTVLNWSEPQVVAIKAVQDGMEEGEHTTALSFTVDSDDPLYNGYFVNDITVYITDSVSSPCPDYDIDGDCRLSIADLEILARQWLVNSCSGVDCADIAGTAGVDIQDFSAIASEWGEGFGPILINEFVAVNNSKDPELPRESWEVFDEDGQSVDWIELYNVSAEAVDLTGWCLTDDAEDINKWSFPAGQTIAANGYLMIFASGKDIAEPGFIHTNFSLSSQGEYLAIVDPSGEIVHEYNSADGYFPAQEENISYGMFGYFTQQRYFYPATPGAANTNSVIGTVTDTVFSVKRGFYYEPITVRISTKESGTIIRYTLNGSTPTVSNGYIYDPESPVYIDKTTTLRAAAFKTGWLPSNVDTQTYIFINDVITQSPNGQTPGGWPNSYAVNNHKMDYGMDPDIVNNAQYADLMDDALLAIPTLSLVTDLGNLFNSANGVYVCTSADTRINGDKYEKPVSLELINPDGS
ncbi:MAG: lamin tail domain-containing protein, partial [Sedimentisphaerales bacterium]|nr:lamin tail domain-containing protein [Sedimentisphaerales bacterium]